MRAEIHLNPKGVTNCWLHLLAIGSGGFDEIINYLNGEYNGADCVYIYIDATTGEILDTLVFADELLFVDSLLAMY